MNRPYYYNNITDPYREVVLWSEDRSSVEWTLILIVITRSPTTFTAKDFSGLLKVDAAFCYGSL